MRSFLLASCALKPSRRRNPNPKPAKKASGGCQTRFLYVSNLHDIPFIERRKIAFDRFRLMFILFSLNASHALYLRYRNAALRSEIKAPLTHLPMCVLFIFHFARLCPESFKCCAECCRRRNSFDGAVGCRIVPWGKRALAVCN